MDVEPDVIAGAATLGDDHPILHRPFGVQDLSDFVEGIRKGEAPRPERITGDLLCSGHPLLIISSVSSSLIIVIAHLFQEPGLLFPVVPIVRWGRQGTHWCRALSRALAGSSLLLPPFGERRRPYADPLDLLATRIRKALLMTADGRQPHILVTNDTQEILDLMRELLEEEATGSPPRWTSSISPRSRRSPRTSSCRTCSSRGTKTGAGRCCT